LNVIPILISKKNLQFGLFSALAESAALVAVFEAASAVARFLY
jgi:hypothetical protein